MPLSIGMLGWQIHNTGSEDKHETAVSDNSPSGDSNTGMRPLKWLFGLNAVPQSPGAELGDAGPETEPLPPSLDPWYKAPPGFESKQPGDLLRIRSAPGNLTSVIGNPSAAYHILYRTTNSRDQPSWGVTTLFIPQSFYISPSGKAALLSYQFAYNSANLDSSPSIGLYSRLAQENRVLGIKSGTSLLNEMLSKGWIVNTPDYLGPDSAFGARVQAGHATLDSIRAVRNLAGLTGNMELNVVMWGYSGGTTATLAAAELKTRYAPELAIAGTVLGGLVDDISADLDNLNESVIAGTLIAFLLGITAQYPEAKEYLENQLIPETKDEFLSVRNINVADAVPHFAHKNIYKFFKNGAQNIHAPILQNLYDSQAKIDFTDVPSMPMFLYKAIGDEFCPVEQTDETVRRFRERGADVLYERNSVGGHVAEIENGKGRALGWIGRVLGEVGGREGGVRDVTVDVGGSL